jgi:hypothetical protein
VKTGVYYCINSTFDKQGQVYVMSRIYYDLRDFPVKHNSVYQDMSIKSKVSLRPNSRLRGLYFIGLSTSL